jgi:hypothetical protein
VPFSSYPDLYRAGTSAYNTAIALSTKSIFATPSSSQTVNPLATPYVKVNRPSTVITLNFDIATNFTSAQAYIPLRNVTYTTTSSAIAATWTVEYVPNTSGQILNFAITSPASGTSLVWDGGSAPSGPTTYAVYQFYTLDGLNVKAKVLVNY